MVKDQKFNFNVPLEIIQKGDDEAEWRVGGIASTEDKDFQGEIVKIDGLDISTLAKNGFFNEDHKKGFQNILGKIDFAEKRNNEEVGKHLYVEGKLFKTQEGAKAAWNIMKELGNGDKQMQLSVEGKIQKRTGKDRKIITKAKVENVALTLNPINEKTFASFLKSYQDFEQEEVDQEDLEKGNGDIHKKIISFFKENKNPSDDKVHKFAEGLGLEPDKFEEHIYMVLTELINKKSMKKSEDYIEVSLHKSTVEKLNELIDSKKSFKEHIYDIAKSMNEEDQQSFFRVLKKAKETFEQNSIEKALTATHSYASELPSERTGGDVMTQESLDRKKKKKDKIKKVIWEAKKSFPGVNVDKLCDLAFERYEELMKNPNLKLENL